MDADLIVPIRRKSIRGGAVEPWNHALEKQALDVPDDRVLSSSFKDAAGQALEGSPARREGLLLSAAAMRHEHPLERRRAHGHVQDSFEGIIPMLMRRFKRPLESMRKHYLRYFSDKPCSAAKESG